MPSATIIDYGIGNIYSVTRAVEHCGYTPLLSSDAAEIVAAERLILPGVGAFADGMQGLKERALVDPIRKFVQSGRPLLGICLGMQMLATMSEEFGEFAGLDIIPGKVVHIPTTSTDGQRLKSPHIGWNALLLPPSSNWASTPLRGQQEGASVYLVHSFHFVAEDNTNILAQCDHGGHKLTAAVRKGHITGCQFHPEKSGEVGLTILRDFLAE